MIVITVRLAKIKLFIIVELVFSLSDSIKF